MGRMRSKHPGDYGYSRFAVSRRDLPPVASCGRGVVAAGRGCARLRVVTKTRLKALLAEYGRLALWTYLTLFVLVLLAFALAFSLGFQGQGLDLGDATLTNAGVLGAAYVATKVTQPLRILATLALTPLLARVLERWRLATSKAD